MPLPTRPLGRLGLPVSSLGFGTAPLGDLYEKLDDRTAVETVEAALRGGVTLLDTSPHYGNGLAEHRVGTALRRGSRDAVLVSTKVGRVMDPHSRPVAAGGDVASPGFAGGMPHKATFDYSYDGTLRSLEHSLLRLGTDRIDILLIHDVDVWTHGAEGYEQQFRNAMAGAYKALERLRSEGVVKAIGVGVNEADVCERFAREGDFDTMLLAGRYSLLEQPAIQSFLPLASQKGIGILLGGVYNSGILATGAVPGARYNYRPAPPEIMERVARIEKVCKSHGVAIADAALHFPLGHPAISSVVLGGVAPAEVTRNIESLARSIPASLWSDLKSEKLLEAAAPVPA